MTSNLMFPTKRGKRYHYRVNFTKLKNFANEIGSEIDIVGKTGKLFCLKITFSQLRKSYFAWYD